ncbi:MAG: glycosyltransferase [Betaproteobacteria bacterium]|nr:glycosyltransferase [Betaproteobacteria bacterium]
MTAAAQRILLVAHDFPPQNWAGVELYTLALARALIAQGVDAAVLYPAKPGDTAMRIEADRFEGVPVFRFVHPFDACAFVFQQAELEAAFAELLRRESFTTVHFQHLQGFPVSFPAVAKSQGCQVAMTLHDYWPLCLLCHMLKAGQVRCPGPVDLAECIRCIQPDMDEATRRAQAQHPHNPIRQRLAAMALALDAVDILLASSGYVLKTYRNFGMASKAILAPIGIEPIPVRRVEQPGVTRVVYVGALHPLKNPLSLVAAFMMTPGHLSLELRGRAQVPGYAQQVLAAAERDPRIRYGGPFESDELADILGRADVLVVPSFYESYSSVAREALSAGVPVFAADVGGMPEIVQSEVNGMLFDPYDLDALAHLLARAAVEPAWLAGLVRGIRPPRVMAMDAADLLARLEGRRIDG